MKETKFVKLSKDTLESQRLINQAIFDIDTSINAEFLVDLCKPVDSYTYMLVYEHSLGLASTTPSIGVKVFKVSENVTKAEHQINEVLSILRNRGDLNFISISQLDDLTYIILFEYRDGVFPCVKIFPFIRDTISAKAYLDKELQELDDNEYFGLQPYDMFMINPENMLILFGDI